MPSALGYWLECAVVLWVRVSHWADGASAVNIVSVGVGCGQASDKSDDIVYQAGNEHSASETNAPAPRYSLLCPSTPTRPPTPPAFVFPIAAIA